MHGAVEAGLREPALRGGAIRFGFVDRDGVFYELSGSVSGDRMSGSFRAGARTARWTLRAALTLTASPWARFRAV